MNPSVASSTQKYENTMDSLIFILDILKINQ
jgi:hypothetical protein